MNKQTRGLVQNAESAWLAKLGSGLIDYSQKMTAAAMQIAEK